MSARREARAAALGRVVTYLAVRVLITGITGFVGSHLAEFALAQGVEVAGSVRAESRSDNIEHVLERLTLVEADLRDPPSVHALLARTRPDRVVHLAGQSSVAASWRAPAETFTTNVLGQVNLLEAMRQLGSTARFLVIGSGEEYGLVEPEDLPIRETAPLRPLSPYAVSKVAQDLMGYQYFKGHGLDIVRARAFAHTGPRLAESFATSSFARQVAEIEAGLRPPVVEVGDLKPRRDVTDVRDIVRGYWLLLDRGTPGEVYNLCSGVDRSIERVLTLLIDLANVRGIEVRIDPARFRPGDVPALRGSPEKIAQALGWRPQIPLEQTLTDLLDDWRRRLASRRV